MSNILCGGYKHHLMKYKGVSLNKDGRIVLKSTSSSTSQKSCGGEYYGLLTFNEFEMYEEEYRGELCKICLSAFNDLKLKRNELRNQNEIKHSTDE